MVVTRVQSSQKAGRQICEITMLGSSWHNSTLVSATELSLRQYRGATGSLILTGSHSNLMVLGSSYTFYYLLLLVTACLSDLFTKVLQKSPRRPVSYCFPGFPGALPGFPGSPGVRSQKVRESSRKLEEVKKARES